MLLHRDDYYRDVSIHAPAWGATHLRRGHERLTVVSIHAPAWGATTIFIIIYVIYNCFNPRSRVGSDRIIISVINRFF